MAEKKNDDFSEKRMGTCLTCPLLLNGFFGERCSVCHCFVRLKTKLKRESCPIGKW
ncbi:DUF6171 family protein [Leptospira ainlahdjerensis]|uniref:DUF6171 family protein n=1 Tax=Leptospira ainlahdjerensis TaxID=2810033 RepID=UPI002FCADDB1